MSERKWVVLILTVIYIAVLSSYWLGFSINTIIPTRDFLYLFTPLAAVLGGVFSLRIYGIKGKRMVTLLLLTAGIASWFIGDGIYDYYQYILNTNPFPSVADYFYIIGYPLLFFGLINEIRTNHIHWREKYSKVLFPLLIVLCVFITMVGYFGVYLAYNAQESFFVNIIAMSYGLGDLVLIITNMLVLRLVLEFRGGKLSKVWIGIFISFISTLIADILFAIYTPSYKTNVGIFKNLIDSLYMLSYLLFAYSLFNFGLTIKEINKKIPHLKKK